MALTNPLKTHRPGPTNASGFLTAILLIIACDGSPVDPIDAAMATDPRMVPPLLEQIEDPVARIAVIHRLLNHHPEQANLLCPQLPAGPERRRCDTIARRPHLWTARPAPAAVETRSAPGPASTRLQPTRWPPAAQAAGCDTLDAEARWRDECVFQTAETLINDRGPDAYADAAALCASSGRFQSDCLAHLMPAMIGDVPAVDAPELAWDAVIRRGQILRSFWGGHDPGFAPVVADRFWSEVLARAYDRAPEVHGVLLDVLPEPAAPHIRASAALRLMELHREGGDLKAWEQRLASALARRDRSTSPSISRDPRVVADRWPRDRGGDGEIPAIAYVGQSRRTVSPEPAIDRRIALVEAAARQRPPLRDVVSDALDDSDPLVRWTAARLMEAMR